MKCQWVVWVGGRFLVSVVAGSIVCALHTCRLLWFKVTHQPYLILVSWSSQILTVYTVTLDFELKISSCHQCSNKARVKRKNCKTKIVCQTLQPPRNIDSLRNLFQNFEINGTTINIEKCKTTTKPYPTKTYNSFYPNSEVKGLSKVNNVEKYKTLKSKSKINSHYIQNKSQNPTDYHRLCRQKNVDRAPKVAKVLPLQRVNLQHSEEPPLFVKTKEAQQVIAHILGITQEQVTEPVINKDFLTGYLEDVYQLLYTRHVETLISTSVQVMPRRSLHIHNQQYLEGNRQNMNKQELTEESSDEEQANLEQPLVRMLPHKVALSDIA